VFSAVFIIQESDGVGDMGSRDNTTADVQTLLEAFVNVSLRFACFNDEAFFDETQNFQSWDYSPQVPDY
jgi:hypothetical protein